MSYFYFGLWWLIVSMVGTMALRETEEFYERKFFEFLNKFNVKIRDGDDYFYRLTIFSKRFDEIEDFNANHDTVKWGINKFSHLTSEEFAEYVNRGGTLIDRSYRDDDFKASEESQQPHEHGKTSSTGAPTSLPASVDWVAAGAVTPVKDQGNCGSCWSFSAVAALEGSYFLKTKSLVSFSEQELVSCDNTCGGCNGCDMDSAFAFVKAKNGLPTESDYPYTSGDTAVSGTCQGNHTFVFGVTPTSYVDVQPNSVHALMVAVAKRPVSVAVEADQNMFQNYLSGVITSGCGQNIDHAVLLVGYGTLNGVNYWKVIKPECERY